MLKCLIMHSNLFYLFIYLAKQDIGNCWLLLKSVLRIIIIFKIQTDINFNYVNARTSNISIHNFCFNISYITIWQSRHVLKIMAHLRYTLPRSNSQLSLGAAVLPLTRGLLQKLLTSFSSAAPASATNSSRAFQLLLNPTPP